ncbi:alpha/beta-hydrolase [Hyaloscypha variabilis]|jgi:pimeloyl-ACP methyl ester carboxylesterase|uniref:Alpha/beta-hydrolase n=1 Tax=Hyaloscypha variabilis (strain UAMH 11265 / GT02V1 / F) TaxID=1149755 RepID=A0A2J6R734_HYAVF|nr:alpha/beta-hydrolase [Hyaloscypha variabilis F]
MSTESTQDWEHGEKSGLVSIGTHKLYLEVSGPDRKPGEPIVVLMQGLGASLKEWTVVKNQVSKFSRYLQYDRTGLGQSESPPELPRAIGAASVASDLDTLLRNAGIEPPFVIVAHSWGGLTSREFLHLRPKDIVGIVFVDANQENHFYYRLQPRSEDGVYWAPWHLAIDKDVDFLEEVGLAREQKLGDELWAGVLSDRAMPAHEAASKAEFRGWQTDDATLAAKKQFKTQPLGNHPVSVLRADSKIEHQRSYDAGVARGNGTEEERASYRDLIAHWEEQDIPVQQEMLKLSTVGRFRTVPGSGHCIQMINPEAVVEEVKWVLDQHQGNEST